MTTAYAGLWKPKYSPRHGLCFLDQQITPMRREYCGPTAIAAVTGASLDGVRAEIYGQRRIQNDLRRDGRDKPIVGMHFAEINDVMAALGWRVVDKKEYDAPSSHLTLRRFAREYGDQGPFIVSVGGHVAAISHGDFCDTETAFPVPLKSALKLERVREYRIQNWCRYKCIDRRQRARLSRRAA